MAKVKVEVEIPDGKYCQGCPFFKSDKPSENDNYCDYVGEFLERGDYENVEKHRYCPLP